MNRKQNHSLSLNLYPNFEYKTLAWKSYHLYHWFPHSFVTDPKFQIIFSMWLKQYLYRPRNLPYNHNIILKKTLFVLRPCIFCTYSLNDDFNWQFHLIILAVCDISVGPSDSRSVHKPSVWETLVYTINCAEKSSTNALWFTGQFTMTTETPHIYKWLVCMKLPLYSREF